MARPIIIADVGRCRRALARLALSKVRRPEHPFALSYPRRRTSVKDLSFLVPNQPWLRQTRASPSHAPFIRGQSTFWYKTGCGWLSKTDRP
jgi:hypothetical protein